MFTMRYQLVPYWYLQTDRGNGNVVLGDFTIKYGITQTNITSEELPPANRSQSKCEVSWMMIFSQHSDLRLIK